MCGYIYQVIDIYNLYCTTELNQCATVEQAGSEKGLQQGLQRGEATILMRLFSRKFGPDAVETYRSRIESAEPEQLEAWSERLLTADTPETIFH